MSRIKEIKSSYPEQLYPVQVNIDVPGVRPTLRRENGQLQVTSNLEKPEVAEQLSKEVHEKKPWFVTSLKEAVLRGERSGIWIPVVGGVSVFVAAAGFEFGIRHGKDIKELYALLSKHAPKKSQ